MMKSIFLSDSKVLDLDGSPMNSSNNNNSNSRISDEYIIVDTAPRHDYDADSDINSELNDEEEYDYCDDALSEGIQYEPFSLTEDMILEEAEQPSIQHILDEAHKSASQLIPASEMPGILESSASDVSVQSSVRDHNREKQKVETSSDEKHLPNAQRSAPTSSQTLLNVGGRMSNKKRRKKMKLLKKAAAAAKAAASLSSDIPQSANTTSSTSSAKSKKLIKAMPNTRYHNKRVANVAVACATETLASYKAELIATSKKVH